MSALNIGAAGAILCVGLLSPTEARAGLGKWFRNEVVPTVTGKRPLRLKPGKVTIKHNGKSVLDADIIKDTLRVEIGPITIKTTKLKQRLAEAGAILAGDTAVLDAAISRQAQRVLRKLVREGALERTGESTYRSSGPEEPDSAGPSSSGEPKTVTLYNLTGGEINYVLNGEIFTIGDDSGLKHIATSGFYLQADMNLKRGTRVGRWKLEQHSEYYLARTPKRELVICVINDQDEEACFDDLSIYRTRE